MSKKSIIPTTDVSEEFAIIVDAALERLSQGESIDAGILQQDYPKHAPQLEAILPSMVAMANLG